MNYLTIIKWVVIAAAIAGGFYIVHRWLWLEKETERMSDNNEQLTAMLLDTTKKHGTLNLNKEEIGNVIKSDPALAAFIVEQRIKDSRIESLLLQSFLYKDNNSRDTDMSGLLNAIKTGQKATMKWKDSTKCLQIEGEMVFMQDTLLHRVSKRTFSNEYKAVGYRKRRQWKFLGIPTRIFGKLIDTVSVTNSCGETKTIQVQKVK